VKGPEGAGALCAREVKGIKREARPEAKRSARKERWFMTE
jgi:hypothetical protein